MWKDLLQIFQYGNLVFLKYSIYYVQLPQLCLLYPLCWFAKDGSGGWSQLTTKLNNHGLDFRGSKVPAVKNAVKDAIKDLHKACIDEGAAEDLELPTKPLTYAALIAQLKTLGLLPSASQAAPGPVAGDVMDMVEEQHQQKLLDDHHNEVIHYSENLII